MPPQYNPSNEFWSGYAGESDAGLAHLEAVAVDMPYGASDVADVIPDEVDVRNDPKFSKSWMRTENQGGVGACQGYALVETIEYLAGVLGGQIVQLSPMFAYLLSQMYDGIKGDRGSTLSGGTRLLEQIGLALLSAYTRERSYPRNQHADIPKAAIESAKTGPYRTNKTVRMRSAEQCKAFIGSFAGIIQTGTPWTAGLANVPAHGVVETIGGKNYGGHSYTICGYKPIDLLGAEARRFVPRTRANYVMIGHNSHDTRYGDQGFMYFTAEQIDQLCRDLLIGRTDMPDIEPRDSKRDFTAKSNSHFSR